jgi:glycerol-3-phosphate acyltransferase PlsY
MQWLGDALALVVAYLLGSVPFGLLVVRVATGKDLRQEHSGRTGGTNAGRAAGIWAGVATALLDGAKAAVAVWVARAIHADASWLHVAAGLLAIVGHNYSIFLIERVDGKARLRGGAGGAPTVGAGIGLWAPSALITIPMAALILFGIGYASLTTLSLGLTCIIIFTVRAVAGASSWAYVAFGAAAEILLVIALRENIQRLIQGNERLVGWRASRQRDRAAATAETPDAPSPTKNPRG